MAQLCLPRGLNAEDVSQLERSIDKQLILLNKKHLFRTDQTFKALYVVRSGCIKSYTIDSDGREQVIGFHLPGELLGLDAIHQQRHGCNAIALDTTSVCVVPFDKIVSLCSKIPSLYKQLLGIMSQKICDDIQQHQNYTVEQRVAGFLLSLSSRYKLRGYSSTKFILHMSREEMGNYLHMAKETVSRVLTHLVKLGVISVDDRQITINSLEQLRISAKAAPAPMRH